MEKAFHIPIFPDITLYFQFCDAGIIPGSYLLQLIFYIISNIQGINKSFNHLRVNLFIGAGQIFELLIWIWIILPPQNCLDCLGNNGPVIFKIFSDSLFIKDKFIYSLDKRFNRNQAVPDWYTDITQDGRISKVPLEPGNR